MQTFRKLSWVTTPFNWLIKHYINQSFIISLVRFQGQTHEKMLNITYYQRNANQNHNEVPFHTVRMAVIQKSTSSKCWRGGGEKRTLLHCWWECKLVQPLWRTVWRFLKKLEIELPYDPAIPLLGIHTEETRIERDTYTPMFIAARFIIARTWKQMSISRWMDKKAVVHIHIGVLLRH